MSEFQDNAEALEEVLAGLEASIGATQAVTAAFSGELDRMRLSIGSAGREVSDLSRSIGWGLRRAFDGVVFDGDRLSDALRTLARSLSDAAYNAAMKPLQNAVGGLVTGGIQSMFGPALPFAEGAAMVSGRVAGFARGGVVTAPTAFPMRGGIGLMGEAGPEAILPLARGADGRLGVSVPGGGGGRARPVQVTMNIHTPDAESFRRSSTQVAAQLSRAIAAAERNA